MEEVRIGFLLKSITDKLHARADATLKAKGLTLAQCRVLAFLNGHDGQATQKEIEIYLDVSHPTVVGLVSRMEQNGFVTYCPDSRDKRNKLVTLTEKAHAVGRELKTFIPRNEAHMVRMLTKDEVKQLSALLQKIYDGLEKHDPADPNPKHERRENHD